MVSVDVVGRKADHTAEEEEEEALWQDIFAITSDPPPEHAAALKQKTVVKTTLQTMYNGTMKNPSGHCSICMVQWVHPVCLSFERRLQWLRVPQSGHRSRKLSTCKLLLTYQ